MAHVHPPAPGGLTAPRPMHELWMGNQFHVPSMVEYRVRRRFRRCAYCGRRMKAHKGVRGCPGDKATFEHLNRQGPFYWSEGLQEKDLVMVCARCNSSR